MSDRPRESGEDSPEKGSLWHDAKAGANAARKKQQQDDDATEDPQPRGALFGHSSKPMPSTEKSDAAQTRQEELATEDTEGTEEGVAAHDAPVAPAVTPPVMPAPDEASSETEEASPEAEPSRADESARPAAAKTNSKPIVRLVDVSKSFGSLTVLDGVSIDIHPGQTTVIMGPSGTGKSVLLKHISGLLKPDRGEVWFEDERIDTMSEKQLVAIRKQMGMLFQMGALFDSMTVGENVMFPLSEHNPRMKAGEKLERARTMLKVVGLKDVDQKMPGDLSGGQKKRVALARAIILGPKLVLYDEPTTGLDPIRSDVINELIIRLTRQLGIASIVVTHDMVSADKIADRMVMLYDGKVVIDDTPEAFHASDNDLVRRFVKGQADQDELDAIAQGIEPVAGHDSPHAGAGAYD